jgi:hypothetical protein
MNLGTPAESLAGLAQGSKSLPAKTPRSLNLADWEKYTAIRLANPGQESPSFCLQMELSPPAENKFSSLGPALAETLF